jgi:TolB protein
LLTAQKIGADVFSPSYTPHPGEILFHAGRSHAALMRASFDARGQATIATVLRDGAANYHATLSPDGRWLTYDSDSDGTRGVYIARADGRQPRKVSGGGYAAVPRWSPDGRRLAFIKADAERQRVWNVWMLDVTTRALSQVTHHSVGQAWGPSWFPDGRRIAYSVEDTLITLDLDSGAAGIVPSPRRGRLVRTPAVSPDGKWIVFQVFRDGVWLLNVSTGTMHRVLADGAAEEFAWSPDSQQVVYHSRDEGAWSVWRLPLREVTAG